MEKLCPHSEQRFGCFAARLVLGALVVVVAEAVAVAVTEVASKLGEYSIMNKRYHVRENTLSPGLVLLWSREGRRRTENGERTPAPTSPQEASPQQRGELIRYRMNGNSEIPAGEGGDSTLSSWRAYAALVLCDDEIPGKINPVRADGAKYTELADVDCKERHYEIALMGVIDYQI